MSTLEVYLDGRTVTPLPPDAYVDEAIFKLEKALLFDRAPKYVGHEAMVPQVGNYRVPDGDPGKVLVHGVNGIELLSNVCKHRQALMLKGSGTAKYITCPLHKWNYSLA